VSVLVDTNILLRLAETNSPQHPIAIAAVDRLVRSDESLYVTLQVLTEAWRAMTGARGTNGLGFPIAVADTELDRVERLFTLLEEDTLAITAEWRRLVSQYQITGLDVFDARLVATMTAHKIDRILTFDIDGFARYGVEVLDPATADAGGNGSAVVK
jgi:predicted nucleic acid-binding protein